MAAVDGVLRDPIWGFRQEERKFASSILQMCLRQVHHVDCACEPIWRFIGMHSSGHQDSPTCRWESLEYLPMRRIFIIVVIRSLTDRMTHRLKSQTIIVYRARSSAGAILLATTHA